jgi:hypothetical protein
VLRSLLALGVLSLAPVAAQAPFPVAASTTLRADGAVYTVTGRQVIPKSVTITSLRAMTLQGRGENAVLVVAGALDIKAALGGKNVIEGVTIELEPECKSLYLGNVDFVGSGGVRTAEKKPGTARIYMEFVNFGYGTSLALEASAGEIDLQASTSSAPVRVRGHELNEKKPNRVKLNVLTCMGTLPGSGLHGGLVVENVHDVTVRNCDLAGAETRFVDCRVLDFDGNNARSAVVEFRQSQPRRFDKTKIHNTDFRSPRVVVFAPAEGKPEDDKKEHLTLESCWFLGLVDAEAICGSRVQDRRLDPKNGVWITFRSTSAKALKLGGDLVD